MQTSNEISAKDKQLISHLLFCRGHCLVYFVGNKVQYLDRTPGQTAHPRSEDAVHYMNLVQGLNLYLVEGLVHSERGKETDQSIRYEAKRQGSSPSWLNLLTLEQYNGVAI